jgi:hypothetical protein
MNRRYRRFVLVLGGPWQSMNHSVRRLSSFIRIIRSLWPGFDGSVTILVGSLRRTDEFGVALRSSLMTPTTEEEDR